MSPGMRLWGACRVLVIRSRPVAQRTPYPLPTVARTRWFADNGNNQPTKPSSFENLSKPDAKSEAPEEQSVISTDNEASSGPPTEGAAAEVVTVGSRRCSTNSCQLTPLAQAKESQEPQIQPLDDATLEQLFYGGKVIRTQSDGGLTTAQEEALYRQGEIPPVAEAEAMMEDEQSEISASTPATIDQGPSSPGLKFAKPTMPYPDGFNHKRRYHPVLEQVTRLLMRHGKLAVAQRVCTRKYIRPRQG